MVPSIGSTTHVGLSVNSHFIVPSDTDSSPIKLNQIANKTDSE